MEGLHSDMCGEDFFRSYEDRLIKVGCERILYLSPARKVSLSRKWVYMARAASESSVYYSMVAADNYYHPELVVDCEKSMIDSETKIHWALMTKGYFYDFNIDRVIEYNYNSLVGLCMTADISKVKEFPLVDLQRGIDGWFSSQMGHRTVYIDGTEHWKKMLCTNGLNNISTQRYKYFLEPNTPFYATDVTLNQIVPEDIYKRMISIRDALALQKVNDDLA